MKRFTLVLDHEAMEEILRDHLATVFPDTTIDRISGLGWSDVTIRMGNPLNEVEPVEPSTEKPDPDEIVF